MVTMTDNSRNGTASYSVHAEHLPGWMRNEMAFCAALIQGADDERFDPMMLQNTVCRTIADAVFSLRAEGLEHNPESVVQWLSTSGTLDTIGGAESVYHVSREPCHPEAIRIHTDSIIRDHERRQAQRRAEQLLHDLNDPTVAIEEAISQFSVSQETAWQPRITMYSSASFAKADFRLQYIIDWLLVEGQPCIVAGPKKSLKTNQLVDLTISMAMAGWFLNFDRFKVNRQYRVGLLSGESGGGTIQETARRICESKSCKLENVENATWSLDLPTFGDPTSERDILRVIEKNRLEVVVFDPAYLCLNLGDDASNLFKVGQRLRSVTRLHQLTGVTPIVAHHFRGRINDPYDPPELEDIAWAGFQEWARQWLLTCRREAYDPERQGDHRLWLSAGGSAGHSSLWGVNIAEGKPSDSGGRIWDVGVMTAAEAWASSAASQEDARSERTAAKAAAETEADAAKLLKIIQQNPDGETERYFRERAGLSGTRAGRAFQHLEEQGEIERCTITKNNRPWDAYRLIGTHRDSVGIHRDSPAA